MTGHKLAIVILIVLLGLPEIVQCQDVSNWNENIVDSYGFRGSLAIDSNGDPHIIYNHWVIDEDHNTSNSSLWYAAWSGSAWDKKNVISTSAGGELALDSQNQPHIIYLPGRNLTYVHLDNGNWVSQIVDSSVKSGFAMVLDPTGSPHVLYTKTEYANNTFSCHVKYASFDGAKWKIQTVYKVDTGSFDPTLSIVLDSGNNPHILFVNTLPKSGTIRYGYLENSIWKVQALFDGLSISNLVINSIGQPSFTYTHRDLTYKSSGNLDNMIQTSTTANYARWNGFNWLSQTIDTELTPSGTKYLNLDINGNPHIYFYNGDSPNSNQSGLIHTYWNGLNWQTDTLGRLPHNTSYYEGTSNVADLAFDAHGNPHGTINGKVGTLRSAALYGGLTYESLKTPICAPFIDINLIIILAATGIALSLAIAFVFVRKKKRSSLDLTHQ